MPISRYSPKNDLQILALGAESAGNFSVFSKGNFFHSEDFGDLLEPKNFARFRKSVLDFLKKEKIKPDVIITDLHPLYVTSVWGKELAKKFKAEHIQVQHHIAHIFSQVEDKIPQDTRYKTQDTKKSQSTNIKSQNFFGISLDGTGYGTDEKIWGGEIFAVKSQKSKVKSIERIGHLENQLMIGGELAIKEPARILINILSKFLSKEEVFDQVNKYYLKNQFELLWNQLQQNFNCLETSSTGRILDAVSVLLGFAKNERKEKHGATYLLEENSTKPYSDLKPKILEIKNSTLEIDSKFEIRNSKFVLDTTHLFQYLIKNINKDKQRLAATAQLYIAEGLYEIIREHGAWSMEHGANEKLQVILSGGIGNNRIISDYFESQVILQNKKPCIACGDAGLSVGQIIYLIMTDKKSNN